MLDSDECDQVHVGQLNVCSWPQNGRLPLHIVILQFVTSYLPIISTSSHASHSRRGRIRNQRGAKQHILVRESQEQPNAAAVQMTSIQTTGVPGL